MASKRMRADIWVSLQSRIESEIERSGLSVNEVVNMALADYFGLSPKGRGQKVPQANLASSVQIQTTDTDEDEDYI